MSRSHIRWAVVLTVIALLMLAAPVLAKGLRAEAAEAAAVEAAVEVVVRRRSPTTCRCRRSWSAAARFTVFGRDRGAVIAGPAHGYPADRVTRSIPTTTTSRACTSGRPRPTRRRRVVSVTAEWGDNLTGDASLKVGSPIRVELGLFDASGVPMYGYTVVKLEPLKLDRESKYGTLAASGDAPVASAPSRRPLEPGAGLRPRVTFSIQNVAAGTYVVPPGHDPTAEINAGGAVVYGYNLRVTAAGQYKITYVHHRHRSLIREVSAVPGPTTRSPSSSPWWRWRWAVEAAADRDDRALRHGVGRRSTVPSS